MKQFIAQLQIFKLTNLHTIRVLNSNLKEAIISGDYSEIRLNAYADVNWYVKNDVEVEDLRDYYVPNIDLTLTIKNGIMTSVKLTTNVKFLINDENQTVYSIPIEVNFNFSSYTVDSNGYLEFTGYSQKIDVTSKFHQAYSGFADNLEFYISASLGLNNSQALIFKD